MPRLRTLHEPEAIAGPPLDDLARAVRTALREDLDGGRPDEDLTTVATVPEGSRVQAEIICKTAGVLCGVDAVRVTYELVDAAVEVRMRVEDRTKVTRGQVLGSIAGPARGVLSGERTALNLLGHLSGVATLTSGFVEKASDVHIVDTRKTLPGLRLLQKYAVRCGGGANHRFGLSDAILVKDNHIAVVGSVGEAVRRAKATGLPVQCEVASADELRAAIQAGADSLLLDNRSVEQLAELVGLSRELDPQVVLEASGNVTLDTVAEVAATGVDRISVGALTHSAPALDLSLRIV